MCSVLLGILRKSAVRPLLEGLLASVNSDVFCQAATPSKGCTASFKGALEGSLASVSSGVHCQVAIRSKGGATSFKSTLEGLFASVFGCVL